MSTDHRVALIISIVGFIVLIIGSVGYVGQNSMDKTLSCILMGIGVAAVIAGMLMICLTKNTRVCPKEEE